MGGDRGYTPAGFIRRGMLPGLIYWAGMSVLFFFALIVDLVRDRLPLVYHHVHVIDEGSVFLLALEQAKGVYGAHQLLIGGICLGTALLHDTYDDFRLLVRPFLRRFLERLFLVLKVGDPWGER